MKIIITLLICALVGTALWGCAPGRAVRVPCDRHWVPINAPLAVTRHAKGKAVDAKSPRNDETSP